MCTDAYRPENAGGGGGVWGEGSISTTITFSFEKGPKGVKDDTQESTGLLVVIM